MLTDGVHLIQKGGGNQDLVFLPPLRVSSATVQVEDFLETSSSANRFIIAEDTAVTMDDATDTTDAEVGPGTADARIVSLVSATGFSVGRHYQISSSRGADTFFVEDIDGNDLVADQPIHSAHPTNATVHAIELRHAFPSASADDETLYEDDRPLVATWKYTLNGVLVWARMQVRIQGHSPFDAHLGAVAQSIRTTWPGLLRGLRETGNSLRDYVRRAADRIAFRIQMKGYNPSTILLGRVGHELIEAQAVELMAMNGARPPGYQAADFLEVARAHFAHTWKAFSGAPAHNIVDIVRDHDGDTATGPQSNRFRRTVRRP